MARHNSLRRLGRRGQGQRDSERMSVSSEASSSSFSPHDGPVCFVCSELCKGQGPAAAGTVADGA